MLLVSQKRNDQLQPLGRPPTVIGHRRLFFEFAALHRLPPPSPTNLCQNVSLVGNTNTSKVEAREDHHPRLTFSIVDQTWFALFQSLRLPVERTVMKKAVYAKRHEIPDQPQAKRMRTNNDPIGRRSRRSILTPLWLRWIPH